MPLQNASHFVGVAYPLKNTMDFREELTYDIRTKKSDYI